MNEHKKSKAWRAGIGPGGIGCPCCNPNHKGQSQKATKRFFNQAIRRKTKQEIRNES